METFSVTYDIVTEESAANGDYDESGFIAENVSLRDAVALAHGTRTNAVDGGTYIECDESPVRTPLCVTVYNGMEYETGAQESRSLHMPGNLTAATRRRIARLMGARV
jgi:hypothetical protein